MDDGEIELSDHVLLSNSDNNRDFHESMPMDSFIDEFLKKNTRTCTHTHTCNPPGPDAAHTHTCYHTHTQVFASDEDDDISEKQLSVSKSRKPSGNREAVRKYREKKKAHTAYLEEEVKKLRLQNQQLLRKLQGQALLEAEVLRLRTLLLDLRGKIDVELGVSPLQKGCNGGFKEGDCIGGVNIQCETDIPCLHPQIGSSSLAGGGNSNMVRWEEGCEQAIANCQINPNGDLGHGLANVGAQLNCLMPNSADIMGSLVTSSPQAE